MSQQPMSWSDPKDRALLHGTPHSDLAYALEHSVRNGLSPELALDLTLHELVIRAADATGASAAALALNRDGEMVCRATAGHHAPDLGVRLNTRDGLSGACLQSREPQLCIDTESDPRVDATASRHLGIRSMLVVPILDGNEPIGIIEVFSPDPQAFSPTHDMLLESFARSCSRLHRVSLELAHSNVHPEPQVLAPDHPTLFESVSSQLTTRSSMDVWTAILGSLVIACVIALTWMVGSRIGWFSSSQSHTAPPLVMSANDAPDVGSHTIAKNPPAQSAAASAPPASSPLVVYDKGKIVFRVRPAPGAGHTGAAAPGENDVSRSPIVWLAPNAADQRLRSRVEPHYPADALAAHRSGDVTLEVVVGNDGSVLSLRTLKGDPLLAEAAASAVRAWRYDPFIVKGTPTEFQTDVTLKFSLPN